MDVTLEQVIAAHESLRSRTPLVQCLTNAVSAQFVANVLLAAGASPAMVDNPEEAAGFADIADAVLVNLGTPTAAQVASQRLASAAAHASGTPWVLDPVGAGGLPWRSQIATELLVNRPTAVRANASEVIGLAGLTTGTSTTGSGGAGSGARGVDSTAAAPDSVVAAASLLSSATVVAASGEIDHIVCRTAAADQLVRVRGGNPMLQRVTATGCALGALTAAYCAVAESPLIGVVAAHVHFALAAENAADRATGPGTFASQFLDALYCVSEDELEDFRGIEAAQLL